MLAGGCLIHQLFSTMAALRMMAVTTCIEAQCNMHMLTKLHETIEPMLEKKLLQV